MSSSSGELNRIVSELEQTRQDLFAANERVTLAKKESDRFRTLSNDIRTEHARLVADETGRRVQAETQVTQLKSELEREKRLRRDAETAANDAAQEQRRHVEFVQDARRQFETRLTALVGQLRAREEQVHNLEYQVRDRDRERQRADALEQIVARREAALQSLSAELVSIRKEHMDLSAQMSAQQIRAGAAEEAARVAREQLAAFTAAAQIAAANSPTKHQQQQQEEEERQMRKRLEASPSPPPPPSIEDDPHVQETARLVTYTKEWVKDTSKDFAKFHTECDHLVELISDTSVILDKGSAQAGLDLAASDRRRQQQLRDLELSHSALQMAQLEQQLPTSTVVRNGLNTVRFQVSKISAGLQGAIDAVKAIRSLADKYCSQIGLPGIQQRLTDLRNATGQQNAPPPLPTPQYIPHHQHLHHNSRNNSNNNNNNNNNDSNHQHHQKNGDSKHDSKDNSRPQSPAVAEQPAHPLPQQQQQQQQYSAAVPTSPVMMTSMTAPAVSLEDFLALQASLSRAELTLNTERAKLENEIMSHKLHLQIEKDRGVAEKEKTIFECERRFAEERRELQRKIDEGEMKLIVAERKREDDLRRAEMDLQKAVGRARDELLEESRALRDQCRSLDREQEEAQKIILHQSEKLTEASSRQKAMSAEAARLRSELQARAEAATAVGMELRMAQESNDELQRLLEAKTAELERLHQQLSAQQQQHQQGGNSALLETSGLSAAAMNDGGRNLWAEWKKNATVAATSNNSMSRIAAAAARKK